MDLYDYGAGGAGLYAQPGRHFSPSDSRLLTNLIKAERNYITHLRSSVSAAHAASAALSAWGTSEAPDVAEASAQLGNLLAASAEVQSTHVAAIEGYRAALKDVADREASIRTVVRDRDILVGRLIKASQKSASTSSKKTPEERAERVSKAQRELSACEEVLLTEEAALVGVKRRTFKEALTMRMKTMGDAGSAMVDAAKEAILLLNDFDSNAHTFPPYSPNYEYGTMDNSMYAAQQQQHYAHPYAQHRTAGEEGLTYDQTHVNHPNFENSSVTPSQSASQIYHPYSNRDSALYAAPFEAGAEVGLAQQHAPNQHPVDYGSDEEDWKRAFGQMPNSRVVEHQGVGGDFTTDVPAPHQLDHRAGAESDFVPQVIQHQSEHYPERLASNGVRESPPPPKLPPKGQGGNKLTKSLSTTRSLTTKKAKTTAASARKSEQPDGGRPALNYVPMPPVPSAPRLDSNGINMGPVPTAPKLYVAGGVESRGRSSSDDEEGAGGRTVAHRGGASDWNMRGGDRQGEQESSDEGTARAPSRANAPRKASLFGKMGRLFKSEEKTARKTDDSLQSRPSMSNMHWDTRTDNNIRHSKSMNAKDSSTVGRKSKALTGPLVPDRADSSDEEGMDERNLVRHVNKGPPLWQAGGKSNSDIGTGKSLLSRPSMIKRMSSASVTVGPLSWKAQQEAQRSSAGTPTQAPQQPITTSSSGTIKRKKKKAAETTKSPASVDGGSEIGTQPTRTRPAASAANQRHSVIVSGDASSGIRRSDSLNYGSMREKKDRLGQQSSKRLSAMSTQQVHGYGTKKGSVTPSVTPGDPSGKFATTNWVAKSNVIDQQAIEKIGQSAAPVPAKAVPQAQSDAPKHAPQPSRTMSPPLKPAIKLSSNDMSRTGSTTSNIPTLPPPVSAPPRVSTLLDTPTSAYLSTPPERKEEKKRLGGDASFDGTGKLDMPSYDSEPKRPAKSAERVSRTALPKIDMPASEPFKVNLEDEAKGKPTTPQNELSAHQHDSSPLMTPNERQAYTHFISQGDGQAEQAVIPQAAAAVPAVTRTTVARASVGNGVLGPKNVPPPTATAGERSADLASPALEATAGLQRPGQLSRSYSGDVYASSDSSEDEDGGVTRTTTAARASETPAAKALPAAVTAVIKKPASILSNSHLQAPGTDGAEKSPEGSTVSRRKSVRMAPDVKFPPETPPGDGTGAPPFGSSNPKGSRGGNTPAPAYTSQLSSRIAPPPPAPGRITVAPTDKPIDIGSTRERTAWTTRISSTYAADDSSEEEEEGAGADSYASARRNFGSISRSWGKAVGRPGGEKEEEAGEKAKGGKKKKKSGAAANSGYNPAIPLPVGMQVVGRSASKRGGRG